MSIDQSTGVVTLNNSADFENQSSYTFEVVATDPLGLTTKAVTVSVNMIEKYGDNPADNTIEQSVQNFPVVRQLQVWYRSSVCRYSYSSQ